MITPVCVTICHFHPACFLNSTSFSCFGRNLAKNGESISIFMRGHKRKPALRKITNYFGMRKDIKKIVLAAIFESRHDHTHKKGQIRVMRGKIAF